MLAKHDKTFISSIAMSKENDHKNDQVEPQFAQVMALCICMASLNLPIIGVPVEAMLMHAGCSFAGFFVFVYP